MSSLFCFSPYNLEPSPFFLEFSQYVKIAGETIRFLSEIILLVMNNWFAEDIEMDVFFIPFFIPRY
jgi:hypothetical protein